MARINLTILLLMISSASFGQMADLLKIAGQNTSAGYHGKIITYSSNGEDNTWVKDIYVSLHDEKYIECKLMFDDGKSAEYWTFKVGSLYHIDGLLIGELSNITLDDATGWAYFDDKATGTYSFNQKDEIESVTIKKFFIHNGCEIDVTISWKVPMVQLAGKTYEAIIRASCSKTRDGGFMTYTYCELTFEKDSVTVIEHSDSTRDFSLKNILIENKYSYTIQGNSITIDGFNEYGELTFKDGTLIGYKKVGSDYVNELIFTEVSAE